jgi:hypothetical protein
VGGASPFAGWRASRRWPHGARNLRKAQVGSTTPSPGKHKSEKPDRPTPANADSLCDVRIASGHRAQRSVRARARTSVAGPESPVRPPRRSYCRCQFPLRSNFEHLNPYRSYWRSYRRAQNSPRARHFVRPPIRPYVHAIDAFGLGFASDATIGTGAVPRLRPIRTAMTRLRTSPPSRLCPEFRSSLPDNDPHEGPLRSTRLRVPARRRCRGIP